MQGEQKEKYQAQVDEWRERAKKYAKGIEEDSMEGEIEYPVRVTMDKYTKRGLFIIPDPSENRFFFANPHCTIGVRLVRAKAHINRLTRCVEEQFMSDCYNSITGTKDVRFDQYVCTIHVWEFLTEALKQFVENQPGLEHDITLFSMTTNEIESYATKIKQTQEIEIACGISCGSGSPPVYYLMLKTPVHTVCPFILHETDGQSHTQRAYIQIEYWCDKPMLISPIIEQINTRLQPCQSSMKIPDEAIQVLRAYCTATYTEDAVLRLLKVIRGIKDQIVPGAGPLKLRIHIHSIESIFQNDMTSEASDVIA